MHDITLIVIGASGRIGREVARLGVGYGAEVYGVTRGGVPDIDEPWVRGVHWLARDATEPGALDDLPRGALVIAAPISLPHAVGFDRVVLVANPNVIMPSHAGLIVASPSSVDDSPLDGDEEPVLEDGSIRVEMLGMALLRAALDQDIPELLDHDQLLRLGDAMMLQGTR